MRVYFTIQIFPHNCEFIYHNSDFFLRFMSFLQFRLLKCNYEFVFHNSDFFFCNCKLLFSSQLQVCLTILTFFLTIMSLHHIIEVINFFFRIYIAQFWQKVWIVKMSQLWDKVTVIFLFRSVGNKLPFTNTMFWCFVQLQNQAVVCFWMTVH